MSRVDVIEQSIRGLKPHQRATLALLAIPRIVDPYTKHIPHPTQQVFLSTNSHREVFFGGAGGGGKLIDVDELVLTPYGFRRNGDLRDGDAVTNPRTGGVARVVKAWEPQTRAVYRVQFDDGTHLDCSGDHLWAVKLANTRSKVRDRERLHGLVDPWLAGYKIMDTRELRRRTMVANQQGTKTNRPMIPVGQASEFTITSRNAAAKWSVDPYLLGVLLGDGHHRSLRISTRDQEIVDELKKIAHVMGGYLWDDGRTEVAVRGTDLRDRLAAYGLETCRSWEKFIPDAYKLSSLAVRVPLMQGLMDTDGYVDARGHMSYCTVSQQLADDVAWLARSLGAYAKVTTKQPYFTKDGAKIAGRPAYLVWIKPHEPALFFRLTRKRTRAVQQQNPPVRRVVAVTQLPHHKEMRCITLDTIDGLYMASDFVVTHNSDALLMAALQFVDVPGYAALILRKTWPDLVLPGAIMDRARDWLIDTPAQPRDGGRVWVFPSGARLQFGYLQYDNDKMRYRSAEFQFIAFDELTMWPQEETYDYLFSRLRKPAVHCLNCGTTLGRYRRRAGDVEYKHTTMVGKTRCRTPFPDPKVLAQYPPARDGTTVFDLPLRMRSASNPGGPGHLWVKDRFIDPRTKRHDVIYIPSRIRDNPSLDEQTYTESLDHLNPVDQARIKDGDWDIAERGDMFDRSDFIYLDVVPQLVEQIRFWDTAASEGRGDWTVGALCGITALGDFVIADMVRFRKHPHAAEKAMFNTARADGLDVLIREEQEPGASGLKVIEHMRRNVFPGFDYDGIRSSGSKAARAKALSSYVKGGKVRVRIAGWNRELMDEFEQFASGAHDDQVDAVAGAFNELMLGRRARLIH